MSLSCADGRRKKLFVCPSSDWPAVGDKRTGPDRCLCFVTMRTLGMHHEDRHLTVANGVNPQIDWCQAAG